MSPMLIAHRYCGPPRSANGGCTAGSLAAQLSTGPVEEADFDDRTPG